MGDVARRRVDLAALTAADFEPLIGTTVELTPPGSPPFPAVLVSVTSGPAGAHREQFALRFEGGTMPAAPQGIFRVDHPALGVAELFLVAVGMTAGGVQYEAIFG